MEYKYTAQGQKLKKLRLDNKLTQKEMGLIIGKTASMWAYYEIGRYKASDEILQKLAKHFGMSLEELQEAVSLEDMETVSVKPGKKSTTSIPETDPADPFGPSADPAVSLGPDEPAEEREGKGAGPSPSGEHTGAALGGTAGKKRVYLTTPGGGLTIEEVIAKAPAGAEALYISVEDNKVYWAKEGKMGYVSLW